MADGRDNLIPGRKPGAKNKLTQAATEHARSTGEMPHEFMLRVSRGELIPMPCGLDEETGEVQFRYEYPTFEQRLKAAKDAAPYFVPKMQSIELIQNVSDEDLLRIIQESAAAAGLGPSYDGIGTTQAYPVAQSTTGTSKPRVRPIPRQPS